ncbi:cyclin-domain-containing protein [Podospora conica]|nr:cyclin-domain-containing protein [Schizothecium conicum]
MGTRYQMPAMAPYENHLQHHAGYAPPMSAAERQRPALSERPYPNEQVYPGGSQYSNQAQNQQPFSLPRPRPIPSSSSNSYAPTANPPQYPPQPSQAPSQSASQKPTRPATPTSGTMADKDAAAKERALVIHSLQIPRCISPRGGNLADLVADLTALFWFDSIQVLDAADKIRTVPPGAPVWQIAESAKASRRFKEWVQSVLSTTQVTQNVILLALLFIHRLKTINPTVKGRQGSEYRLFTVALMLGNKFLDDNTYTNKTWADVSGISVKEIHVMEVEFLSNMRYSLLASKEQWDEWLVKLAKLWEFLDRAQQSAPPSPLLIPSQSSPTSRKFASPLPSPTGRMPFQLPNTYSPTPNPVARNHVNSSNGQSWPSYGATKAVSPLGLKPESASQLLHRKRSFPENDPTEPPAKRMSMSIVPQQYLPSHLSSQPLSQHQVNSHNSQPPLVSQQRQAPAAQQPRPAPSDNARLSVPSLTLNTAQAAAVATQSFPGLAYAPPQASPLSLPPLVSGVRAMSTVYPTSTSTYTPSHQMPVSSGPSHQSGHVSAITPTTNYPPPVYGTPSKRLSPQNGTMAGAGYPGSSPLSDSFHHAGTASGVHTPISHSPSFYLDRGRDSPYKPIRNVNTLLYPASSAFLQQYHFANHLPPTQMHYHPIGKRDDLRTGIVPEFAMARSGHQSAHGQQNFSPATGLYHSTPQVLPDPNQGGRSSYGMDMQRSAMSSQPHSYS